MEQKVLGTWFFIFIGNNIIIWEISLEDYIRRIYYLMRTINNNIHIRPKSRNQREKSPNITMPRKCFVIKSHTIYNYYCKRPICAIVYFIVNIISRPAMYIDIE